MIEQLMVKDYILFDYAFIDFINGMTVITGETGAGKSLLIDAIGYLCGQRVNNSIVRKGKEKAILQMVCSLEDERIIHLLEENGFDVEENLIIQREFHANSKSTIRINQQITTLSFVKKIASYLIDLHSQMDTYQLMDLKVQMNLLDQFAQCTKTREKVEMAYKEYADKKKEYHTLVNETLSDDELEFLTQQYNQIDQANIQENELDELNQTIKEYSAFEKNYELFTETVYQLNKENGLMDQSYQLYRALNKNELTARFAQSFYDMYYQMDEIKEQLQNKCEQYKDQNIQIDEIQERIYTIKGLYKKYGGSYTSLMAYKQNLEKKIDSILHRENLLNQLETEIQKKEEIYFDFAKALSKQRKASFTKIEKEVMENCHDLMLENAQFKISCLEKEPSKDGMDQIEFLVSMNKGQDFSSLKDSASGGELSRLMLALKVVFQSQNGIGTIIFDEIDTGVSGKVAFAMGQKMHRLSKHYQVLCITHLASVACWADRHYCVKKESDQLETKTTISLLNDKECIEELAMMSSGQINPASLEAAQELKERIHG